MKENKDIVKNTNEKEQTNSNISKILVFFVVTCITVFIFAVPVILIHRYKTMIPRENVFVDIDDEESDAFVNYIKNDLQIDWVPTFIVVQDGKYIGTIKGQVDTEDFDAQFSKVLSFPNEQEMPDFTLTNINDEKVKLSDITNRDICFIELAWVKCPDCIEQDDYNIHIFDDYGSHKFYIFYFNSDVDEVKAKYN